MLTPADLRKAHADKLAQAQALSEKTELTAEESAKFDALIAEAANDLAAAEKAEAEAAAEAKADADRRAKLAEMQASARKSQGRKTAPTQPGAAARVEGVRDLRAEDRKHGFRDIGEFGAAVFAAMNPSMRAHDERLEIGAAATGLNQGSGAEGGFLVPPEFSQQIWDGMNQDPENLLARCDQYTVTGESLTFNANAETSRANGSRWGGVQSYWIAEAGQITNSKPTFRQVRVEPQQLAVLIYATDKLLGNASALEQYLSRAAQAEITFKVNDAIINGTGAGQPKGILASGCKVSVSKESGQSSSAGSALVFDNVVKMWARCHARSRAGAVWYINQELEPSLHKLALNIGTGGVPAYMPPGGLSGARYGTLMGRPVIPVEYCAAAGTEGDIIIADLGAYCAGVKGGVQSAMSMHLRFDYAETAFRFMFAVDGQPWLASAITPFKGSNTLSPFVTLAAR